MASGIFILLDDIAALMDDVAMMSKIATKKTAGILGDDLAVNAEKAMGFVSSREIPVIWAITKGSFINKLIILPIAFGLSALYPPAIIGILMLGGLYLAYEGAEKVFEVFVPHPVAHHENIQTEFTEEEVLAHEKNKIKSAVKTDFILSLEIVIIALGTVSSADLVTKIAVVSFVAIVATIGVYGIVALIVRMDDFGYAILKKNNDKSAILKVIGQGLVNALPWVIKALGVIGTIALILVAGGIFTHNIPYLHHLWEFIPAMIKDFTVGLVIGFAVLVVVKLGMGIWKKVFKN